MRFACRGVILTVFLTLPAPAAAQSAASSVAIDYERAHESRKLVPPRLTSPIALDGRLDEPAWASAALAKGFLQNDPREGAPATFDTEVRVLYDADAIYLGLFARDDSPGKIIVSELKKDFDTGRSDAFIFIIDSFRDLRNGYMFAINPGGAKWDGQMSNEGRETNASWDGIWDVAARIGDDGWYAEVRVPFRTMKFKPEDTQTWGINFQRRNRRLNENSFWSPIPRIQSLSRVSLAGTVENLQQVRPGRSFRLKPWALASATSIPGKTTGDGDAGLDLKLGVTNGLTFDATVNTDFSQVEADEQQINLTRFSLFFPEKREFFLENSGVFQFGAGALNMGGGGGGGRQNPSQDMTLFFSRQIGLSAAGDALPILAGLRLTGRAGPFSVGVMNVEQRRHDGVAATNFTALRLRRDILRASDIGVMVLNKDGATTNRVVGADANFRFFTDLRFNAAVAKTMSPGSVTPGTGRDWYSRTTASYRSSFWDLRAFYQAIGERFNDEMGFVPRRGVNNGLTFAGMHFRPQRIRKWVRDIFPHWQLENFSRQHGGGTESRYMDWHLPFTFQDSTFVEIGVNPNVEVIRDSFSVNRQRGINITPGRYTFNEYFAVVTTNSGRRLSGTARIGTGAFYDGERTSYTLGATLRANAHFNLSLNASLNDVDLPAGAFHTTLVTTRVNYFFTTKMYVNALVQYNTDARQWSSNVRFNFIHHPLSDFYLVFNERRHSVTGALIDRAVVAKFTYLMAF
ncbi:MAG TPA: DUF5916 domain-containing protein [Vicinamibacterales bacterium]|nr:DUF5916 domain-containing protein [Vicinamibacterales bacterium]